MSPGSVGGRAPSSHVRAFVAAGSNLGARERHMAFALEALAALEATQVVACSRIYETEPVGPPPQGRYLNGVVELRTRLAPAPLLSELLEIERRGGRDRETGRNRPRTLDLDLLAYGDRELDEPGLRLPHPRLAERPFVLEPFCELAPGLRLPGFASTIEELAELARDPRAVRPWSGGSRWRKGLRAEAPFP